MSVITFTVPLPPRALRRNSETAHKGYRAKLVREYQEDVWCAAHVNSNWVQVPGALPWQTAHLVLTWRHHRQGPDRDNALASCKALIDVLHTRSQRPLGLVVDDSPAHLTVEMLTQKVAHKSEECVVVELREGALQAVEEAIQ